MKARVVELDGSISLKYYAIGIKATDDSEEIILKCPGVQYPGGDENGLTPEAKAFYDDIVERLNASDKCNCEHHYDNGGGCAP